MTNNWKRPSGEEYDSSDCYKKLSYANKFKSRQRAEASAKSAFRSLIRKPNETPPKRNPIFLFLKRRQFYFVQEVSQNQRLV